MDEVGILHVILKIHQFGAVVYLRHILLAAAKNISLNHSSSRSTKLDYFRGALAYGLLGNSSIPVTKGPCANWELTNVNDF